MLIRPIRNEDLSDLYDLADEAGVGMTNLPKDKAILQEKIDSSKESFKKNVKVPGDEFYFFVLEEPDNQKVVGTAALFATVGLGKPFYSYKVATISHTSKDLEIYNQHKVLHLVNDYNGYSEIGTLFLSRKFRGNKNGQFLSRCRFLFLAQFKERFNDSVMAEMRGYHNEDGISDFWVHLGKIFFNMKFDVADILSVQENNQFIADLMPKYPIYVELLPEEAQKKIGQVHPNTEPALHLLKKEGFRYEDYIDIFDGGPAIHAPLDQLKTVRESRIGDVVGIVNKIEGSSYIVSNTNVEDFRISRGVLKEYDEHRVTVCTQLASKLKIQPGEQIRYIEL